VVGVEPWGPAIELARQRVQREGLEERVELREQSGEQLTDEEAFDLAWIPGAFVGERAVGGVVARVHQALRRGGFLLFPVLRATTDPLAACLSRLRTTLFGGRSTTPEEVTTLLTEHGFTGVRELGARPMALTTMIVAQRAP
jgi:cyclopropane fatty-acyl-phospholipid synthase-like methyltransferase